MGHLLSSVLRLTQAGQIWWLEGTLFEIVEIPGGFVVSFWNVASGNCHDEAEKLDRFRSCRCDCLMSEGGGSVVVVGPREKPGIGVSPGDEIGGLLNTNGERLGCEIHFESDGGFVAGEAEGGLASEGPIEKIGLSRDTWH